MNSNPCLPCHAKVKQCQTCFQPGQQSKVEDLVEINHIDPGDRFGVMGCDTYMHAHTHWEPYRDLRFNPAYFSVFILSTIVTETMYTVCILYILS